MATDDRIQETVERLKALALDGDSRENLGAICSVLYMPNYGWTRGDCKRLRDVLVGMLEQLDPDEWSDEYLAEQGLMRLPKDADGEPIRIGDCMEVGLQAFVTGVTEKGFYWLKGTRYEYSRAGDHRHHREPTVEELLDEMYSALDDSRIPNGSESRSYDEIISEYADKIRELIGNE